MATIPFKHLYTYIFLVHDKEIKLYWESNYKPKPSESHILTPSQWQEAKKKLRPEFSLLGDVDGMVSIL